MTQEKFTKGPWYTTSDNKGRELIVRARPNKFICDCDYGRTNKQDEANANLIAAAPLMYEALKEIAENYDLFKSTKNMAALTLAAKAKAALLKANGTITK